MNRRLGHCSLSAIARIWHLVGCQKPRGQQQAAARIQTRLRHARIMAQVHSRPLEKGKKPRANRRPRVRSSRNSDSVVLEDENEGLQKQPAGSNFYSFVARTSRK